jgi:cyclopropane-fatty-acyl-phospholipid synthase
LKENPVFKTNVRSLLTRVDIPVRGGDLPETGADYPSWSPVIRDKRLVRRLLLSGSLGLGEAYQDGWWECDDLPSLFEVILKQKLDHAVRRNPAGLLLSAFGALVNLQSRSRAFAVGERHYDLGNELYQYMLGETMQYSCGYWREAKSLDEAQRAKMRLIAEKLKLERGMRVLELGCGFGELARFLAAEYGVKVAGYTVSKEQVAFAKERCAGLPVEVRLADYRSLPAGENGTYDRVVSVGMFEHVGPKNYRTYMRTAHRALKRGGLFLLHSIGGEGRIEPWLHRYIFPGGILPQEDQVTAAFRDLFVMEDWHNFGAHYAKTLAAWQHRFRRYWGIIQKADAAKFDQRFFRTWIYYLSCCEGAFRARRTQLWQVVLSKDGVPGGYRSVR